MKDAPILLLDGATASVDPDSELEIRQGLAALMAGRTVIMIAHRLRSVADADQIVFFNRGRIEAAGQHAGLLSTSATYRTLWQSEQHSCVEA